MDKALDIYENQFNDLLLAAKVQLSNIKPSEWTEKNVIMGKPFPGPYRYTKTPYWREIIDNFHPSDPMKWMAVKKGAQIGFSAGVLIPILLWMIINDPSNTYFLVGDVDLVEKATEKLDIGIDNAGLRKFIKPQVQRKRNNKTGDTNNKKEFAGGYIHIGSANKHKAIRDVSLKYGLFDDFESVKGESKESGKTMDLLEQRFAAYADSHKICYGSTPELAHNSNITEAYLLGDQRKYMIPAPCCGNHIEILWATPMKNSDEKMAGITWELREDNTVIPESVGYICQECGGFFDDKEKSTWLKDKIAGGTAFWKPTKTASRPGFKSYHISSLYAPIGMYGWLHYVNKYIAACPPGMPRDEASYKTFVNVTLGETYEEPSTSVKPNQLQLNIRNYKIGIVPEQQSIKDGNGKIVFLTCAADLGGRVTGINSEYDDVRLDYEVTAHSESGSTYSVTHGSIGTFIPNQSKKDREELVRELFTYDISKHNNVWKPFDKMLGEDWQIDTGGKMKIAITGIDTGFSEAQVFAYIDRTNHKVVGLKGDKEDKYVPLHVEQSVFKISTSRPNLYLLRVGQLKNKLMARINFNWDRIVAQPPGYLNFPEPGDGKYRYDNYFSHYEAEHRVLDKKGNFIWQKKTASSQNHFFDVNIYNSAVRDIAMYRIFKELKLDTKEFGWVDFARLILTGKV